MKQRILIVRTDRIGDLVLTIPMASVLKQHDPETHVMFLVQSYTAPLLSMSPEVDEVLLYDDNWPLAKKISAFKSANADVAIFPSPKHELAIAASLARIPVRIGTAYRWYSPLFTDRVYDHRKTAEYHEAEYNVRMLQQIGIYSATTPLTRLILPEAAIGIRDEIIGTEFQSPTAKYVVLHVGSGGSTPNWELSNFVEVGKWVTEKLGLPILLTGTDRDRARIEDCENRMKENGIAVSGNLRMSIIELAGILERAELVVAVGTGPGHLAASMGARTIGIFPLARAISKERWGFRGVRALNLYPEVAPNVSCPMCTSCECLEHVSSKQVIFAAEALLMH